MADEILELFGLAARGVNVTVAPTHLSNEEVSVAQNAEYVSVDGEGALDQRPGMTKVNTIIMDGEVVTIHDILPEFQSDLTAYLYAGMGSAVSPTWRRTLNGTTWENVTMPMRPFSFLTGVLYPKGTSKAVTVGKFLYYFDASYVLHQFDGTNDVKMTQIPPAVVGTLLATPSLTVTAITENVESTAYSYKVVAKQGTFTSAASGGVATGAGKATLNSLNFNEIIPDGPISGTTSYDVYRTSGGATQGKIGSIPVSGGTFTTGNGSGAIGATFLSPAPSIAYSSVPLGATTYTYKLVQVEGTNHGAVSTGTSYAFAVPGLTASLFFTIDATSEDFFGVYDVYRTAGEATQGKIGQVGYNLPALVDTGIVADSSTPPVTAVGLRTVGVPAHIFTDAGLTGDATTPPTVASGPVATNAIHVLDTITDGAVIYVTVLDAFVTEPNPPGRLLAFYPSSNIWRQIGANFATANGSGTAGALVLYDGALSYLTYVGTTSGAAAYGYTTGEPTPAGGIPEIHVFSTSYYPTCVAVFKGVLYVGTCWAGAAGTSAIIVSRVALATWATARTAAGTSVQNSYTYLYVFNGLLFSAYFPNNGVGNSLIESTADGVTWVTEASLLPTEVVTQMTEFNGDLYVVCGQTSSAFNTTTRILKRTAGGTWTSVDDPADSFAGPLAVVYT